MLEIRDTSEALDDEGNASSSTPLEETATITEGSAKGNAAAADVISQSKSGALITSGWQRFVDWHGLKDLDVIRFYKLILGLHPKHFLIDYAKAEGNVVSTSKNLHTKQVRDEEVRHDVISESKFGGGPLCSSERAKLEQQGKDGKFHRRAFLFELWLRSDDVEEGMPYITKKKLAKHFLPIPTHLPNYKYENQIVIFDTQNQNLDMTLVYNSFLSAFFITRGWHRFVIRHGVKVTDVICFYKPLLPLHDLHFLIEHVKRGVNTPEFKSENFLFELQLNFIYGYFDWLKFPKEEVRNHFPAIEKPGGKGQLYFNDAQNNDWLMAIFFDQDIDAYVLMDGWEGFVSKHRLEEM
ncbi:hypothetical protein TEA_009721 [Camellia sinensis var. sinensis]|uniref:TF-B3 domain-containing protein n=1 Tax=Camellia sinensis var. sinensis TaxID=542762 RepID=A0A4S4EB46_CAMSN|nr:hypothetical protein TEA_009721 [Camellia sinensis var. sinensis]